MSSTQRASASTSTNRKPFWSSTLRLSRSLATLSVLVCGLFATAHADDGRHLVFIACPQDYAHLVDLQYSMNDGTGLAGAYRSAGVSKDNIYLLHEKQDRLYQPTKVNFEERLAAIVETAKPEDELSVFFIGHAFQYAGEKDLFLCPAEARVDDKSTLIPLAWVYETLGKCAARRKLLVIDACRKDPREAYERSLTGSRKLEETIRQPNKAPSGTVVVLSCSEGQQASEHRSLEHGVFTNFWLEGLTGKADKVRDGKLTFEELTDYAQAKTEAFAVRHLGKAQTSRVINPPQDEFVVRRWDRVADVERDDAIIEPVYLISMTSGEETLSLIKYLGGLCGHPNLEEDLLKELEQQGLQGRGGLDFTRRWGMYWTEPFINGDDAPFPVILLPVQDQMQVVDGLRKLFPKTEQDGNVWLCSGHEGLPPLKARFANGYLWLSNAENADPEISVDPEQLLAGRETIEVSTFFGNIPLAKKQEMLNRGLQDAEDARADQLWNNVKDFAALEGYDFGNRIGMWLQSQLMKHVDRTTLGLHIDTKAKTLTVDLTFQMLSGLEVPTVRVGSIGLSRLVPRQAMAGMTFNFELDPGLRDYLHLGLTEASSAMKLLDSAQLPEIGQHLMFRDIDLEVRKLLAHGRLEGAVFVHLADNVPHLCVALNVPKEHQWAELFGRFMQLIKAAGGTHNFGEPVKAHGMTIVPSSDQMKEGMALGIADDSLWLVAGAHPNDVLRVLAREKSRLKAAHDTDADPVAMTWMRFAGLKSLTESQGGSVFGGVRGRMRKAMNELATPGQDLLAASVERVDGGYRLAVHSEEGMLRLIGHAIAEALHENDVPTLPAATEHLLAAEYFEAHEAFSKIIASDPANLAAFIGRSRAAREIGEFEAALKDGLQAATLNPKSALAHVRVAEARAGLGMLADALTSANKAVELDPTSGTAYMARGHIYLSRSQLGEALRDFDAAVSRTHEDPVDLANLHHYRATSLIGLSRPSDAATASEAAQKQFDVVLQAHPKHVGALNDRANNWHLMGDIDRAIEGYSQSIIENPDIAIPYSNRATLWLEKEQWNNAIADCTKSLEINQRHHPAYLTRGIALFKMEQWQAAADDFSKLIELQPKMPNAYRWRANSWDRLNEPNKARQDRISAAQADAQLRVMSGLEVNLKDPDYLAGLKYFEGREEQFNPAKARESFERAAERGHVMALAWLANDAWNGLLGSAEDRLLGAGLYQALLPEIKALADKGVADAQDHYGFVLWDGIGVPKDTKQGVEWLRKGASQGWVFSQFMLGASYLQGEGVPQSDTDAFRHFRQAADKDYPFAMRELAGMYLEGRGIAQSDVDAYQWFQRAADSNEPSSIVFAAALKLVGRGTTKNVPQATATLKRMAQSNHKGAAKLAKEILQSNNIR